MTWYSFLTSFVVGIFFFFVPNLEWLGLVFLIIAFILLVYPRSKAKAKKSWEEMKKADAFYPEKKFFDTYPKTAGKSMAEIAIPAKDTKSTAKNWLHKSHQIATNFFKELDELFK